MTNYSPSDDRLALIAYWGNVTLHACNMAKPSSTFISLTTELALYWPFAFLILEGAVYGIKPLEGVWGFEFATTVKFRLSMRCAFSGSAVLIPKKGLVGFGV